MFLNLTLAAVLGIGSCLSVCLNKSFQMCVLVARIVELKSAIGALLSIVSSKQAYGELVCFSIHKHGEIVFDSD